MTESIESLSDWANVQFPNADKSLELLPKVLEQCWTTETSLKTRVCAGALLLTVRRVERY